MIRKFFMIVLLAGVLALAFNLSWAFWGEVNTSEAAHFDQSATMVKRQTTGMSASLVDTGAFVETKVKVSEIASLPVLMQEWKPLYKNAHSSYRKLESAVAAMEERAEEYFEAQRALTQKFHDPAGKARAQAVDESHYARYTQWKDQAHRIKEQSRSILNRLDDMDTELEKLKLMSEFTFDVAAFQSVPLEITVLDVELGEFRVASENIREITKSPFELN